MAILGRMGSSMGRVRQQAVPAQGLKLTPAQVAKMQQEQSRAIMKQPQQPSGLKAIGRQATPAEVAALKKQSPNVAPYNEGLAKSFQQFNAQPKAPTVSPQVAQQMSAMGPKMPAMAKGGMTKKTGYAKGGAVMCGASMPPAQKGKK